MYAVRIDMRITDQAVLTTIQEIQRRKKTPHVTLLEIAQEMDCHIRTVFRAVNRLRDSGRLKVTPRRGTIPQAFEVTND
jgi:Mn-dependent DtxR family transcriptional regulator